MPVRVARTIIERAGFRAVAAPGESSAARACGRRGRDGFGAARAENRFGVVAVTVRRGRAAHQTNMLGSARQYYEKAKAALENQNQKDEYAHSRLANLTEWLNEIQSNLKSVNAQDRAKRQEEERDELDELFAPKKKW